MYIEDKYMGEPKYKIGQTVYTIIYNDSESRWVCRLKIIAFFPSYLDCDHEKISDILLYETFFIDKKELHGDNLEDSIGSKGIDVTDTFKREYELFDDIDDALSEAYRQIYEEMNK